MVKQRGEEQGKAEKRRTGESREESKTNHSDCNRKIRPQLIVSPRSFLGATCVLVDASSVDQMRVWLVWSFCTTDPEVGLKIGGNLFCPLLVGDYSDRIFW